MRRLQTVVQVITVGAEDVRDRAGDVDAELERSSAAAVSWDMIDMCQRRGSGYRGACWDGVQGDRYVARASLARSAQGYTTDAAHDVAANGPRWARSPTLRASGARAWYAIELFYEEPTDATSVRFRVWDGIQDLWWSGFEWAAATHPTAHWNGAAEVQAHFAALPGDVRAVAVKAWLSTSSRTSAPAFYGCRVAFGVRLIGALDNALIRTVVGSMRAELRAAGVLEWITPATTTAIPVPGPEWRYRVTAVDAVVDLTADPYELAPLAGTFSGGTWTAAAPIAAGHRIRVEFTYLPSITARTHQDLVEIKRLPAIYLAPSGDPSALERGQGSVEVRDRFTSPPSALIIAAPDLVTVPLQVRALAELGSDAERLGIALMSWLSPHSYRRLLSPETGELITVRALGPVVETSDLLAQGLVEGRSAWALTFPVYTAETATRTALIREQGVIFNFSED